MRTNSAKLLSKSDIPFICRCDVLKLDIMRTIRKCGYYKFIHRFSALGISFALAAGVSSCALIPKEEVFETAPLVAEFNGPEYHMAECRRRDLLLTESISCSYVPVRRTDLYFPYGAAPFDAYLAATGENVTEGQVIAELEMGTLPARIAAAEKNLDDLKTERRQLEEKQALLLAQGREDGQDFEALFRDIDDRIYIAGLRLKELEGEKADRQIIAPYDGTITYERRLSPGETITGGDKIVILSDSTKSIFLAQTKFWSFFSEGDEVTIVTKEDELPATVVSEETLGIPVTEHMEGRNGTVYFALDDGNYALQDKAAGKVELVISGSADCLAVPKTALATINGTTVVYYLDENGIRTYKEVETGITVGSYTEIIKGLDEGDLVITN